MMYKSRLIILFSLLCCISIQVLLTEAQESSSIVFYEDGLTDNFFWSADSTTLYFMDFERWPRGTDYQRGLAIQPVQMWVAYDVYEQTIQSSDVWFGQPDLSASDYDRLDAAFPYEMQKLFPNPDRTLYVYAQAPHGDYEYWISPTVGITDGTHEVGTDVWFTNQDDLRFNQVLWNETSTSFVVFSLFDINVRVGYVTDFYVDGNLTIPTGMNWWDTEISRDVFFESSPLQSPIYDVSDNQPGVLMLVVDGNAEGNYIERSLPMVWNPLEPEQSEFFDSLKGRGTQAGIFAPDDEAKIIFVDETGLILYDRNTDDVSLLDDNLDLENIWQPRFSPDGRWLFYHSERKLFILDVVSLLPD